MIIEQWFPSVIAYTDGNLLDQLPNYTNYCEELTRDVPRGRPFMNSQLISTLNYHNPAWDKDLSKDPRFKQLFDIVLEQGNKFAEYLGYKYELEITNAWANKIGPNDYHGFHSHISSGDALIVGCFYVAAPKGSKICFKSPYADDYSPIDPSADTPYNVKIVQYNCVPGRLMLFRANLLHGYDAHNMPETKYSIPFNLSIKKKDA